MLLIDYLERINTQLRTTGMNQAMMEVRIVGVYPVDAPEPCHLIELALEGVKARIDFLEFTQVLTDLPRDNWQVPWDERFLDFAGTHEVFPLSRDEQPSGTRFCVVFFFHYLDLTKPLLTPVGALELPEPIEFPNRLSFIRYELPH